LKYFKQHLFLFRYIFITTLSKKYLYTKLRAGLTLIPTLRLGAEDLPVIVVLAVLGSIERLKKELEPALAPAEEKLFDA